MSFVCFSFAQTITVQSALDLAKDHAAYWLQYKDSDFDTLPSTPYLISMAAAVLLALVTIWIVWRLLSWLFRKLLGKGKSKQNKLSNSIQLSMPEGYEQWPKTIQETYLAAELFILELCKNKTEGALEAIQSLSKKDTAPALHLLGTIRDKAQQDGDTQVQVKTMRFASAIAFPDQVDLAKQTIEHAVALTPKDPMLLLQNGDIALKQKKGKEAFQSYQMALKHAKEQNHIEGQVSALATLGMIYLMQKDIPKAEQSLTESVALTETALQNNTKNKSWSRLAAKNYKILGKIKQAQQNLKEAQHNYDKAIAIKEQTLKSEKLNPLQIRTLYLDYIHVGSMMTRYKDKTAARPYFHKAVLTSKKLMEQFPDQPIIAKDYAITLNKIGQNDLLNRDFETARQNFVASLAVRQRLYDASTNKAEFSRDLAIGHERMGDLFSAMEDFTNADTHFTKAKSIIEELVALDKDNLLWQEDLSRYLNRMAFVQNKTGNETEAASFLKQAITIKEGILQKVPEHIGVSTDLASSYILLSRLDNNQAKTLLEKALVLLKSLLAKNKLPKHRQDMIPGIEKQIATMA